MRGVLAPLDLPKSWMNSLRWFRHHVLSGICSGFPLCCITFFCVVWSIGDPEKFWAKADDPNGWRARYLDWVHRRVPGGFGYVPCPLCALSRSRVEVRRCGDHCNCLARCATLLRRNR